MQDLFRRLILARIVKEIFYFSSRNLIFESSNSSSFAKLALFLNAFCKNVWNLGKLSNLEIIGKVLY